MVSATELVNSYVENEDEILDGLQNIKGIKSEFYCDSIQKAITTSKFLSIYSDFTSVFMMPSDSEEHLIHYYPHTDSRFIKRNITFPAGLLKTIPEPQHILPSYTTHTDSATRQLITELSPFIDSRKLLIRPIRTIILRDPSHKSMIYYANSDTANDSWKIKESNEKDSFVIDNGLHAYQSKVLYEITLPFIENISAENLNKILIDETDLLGNFRITLKKLLKSSVDSETSNVGDLYNDVLRPELETINRKFKLITNLHRLGLGASLAAFTISLIAVNANWVTNFQTLFNTGIGSGALGFLAADIKFQTDDDKLKDNPYFLLWKINRAK